MDKILKRIELLFSAYEPSALYLGFVAILVFLAIIVSVNAGIYFIRNKKFKFSLFGIPSFFAIIPAVFSVLVIASGRINIFICAAAGLISFLLNYYFIYFDCEGCETIETYLCFGQNGGHERGVSRITLYGGLLLISLFYLFSIDHNWVPPQYDVTSYQFIGDLLFRNKVYPVVPFAGDNTMTILVPPGYFIYDFVSRLIWNSPRAALLVSVLFFIVASIAFIRLGSLFFETKKIESFVLLALLTRGFFWNAWEFNLLRFLSLISSIVFLCALINFYRAKNFKKAIIYVIFAQLFLSSAVLTHPHCVYILAGVLSAVTAVFLVKIFKNKGSERKKGIIFFASLFVPFSLFFFWYWFVVVKHSSANYVLGLSTVPIPNIRGLLFHFNGIVPIIFTFITMGLLLYKKKKFHGSLISFLFVFVLGLSYFQGFLGVLFSKHFQTIDFTRVNDFTSARYFVKTPFTHPDATFCKMISFWWFAIIAMGWIFFIMWGRLKRRISHIGFLFGAIVILSGDILFMYYNKPIIKEKEYLFLENLEKRLPQDAVIIAPPGYEFSAWTGPVLHRDSLSNRAYHHSVNSISKNISQEIEQAYKTADFNELLKKLPRDKVYLLFNSSYDSLVQRFLKDNNWQLFYNEGNNYTFKYKMR